MPDEDFEVSRLRVVHLFLILHYPAYAMVTYEINTY